MLNTKNKILIMLFMLASMLFAACGGKTGSGDGLAQEEGPGKKAGETSAVMEGTIEVEEKLPDRDIVIPGYLAENNETVSDQEEGSDGAVYYLSGEEQAKAAREIAEQIKESVNQVLADKDFYPNIIGISVNSECTQFNVTFSGRELSLYENTLQVSLCIVGDRFQLYQGKDELMTVVNYIDGESGEVFNTFNSGEIE